MGRDEGGRCAWSDMKGGDRRRDGEKGGEENGGRGEKGRRGRERGMERRYVRERLEIGRVRGLGKEGFFSPVDKGELLMGVM